MKKQPTNYFTWKLTVVILSFFNLENGDGEKINLLIISYCYFLTECHLSTWIADANKCKNNTLEQTCNATGKKT